MAITNHERIGKALDQLNSGLRPSERSLVSELRAVRNRWARPEGVLDGRRVPGDRSVSRLMTAVSADIEPIEQMKAEILRLSLRALSAGGNSQQTYSRFPE